MRECVTAGDISALNTGGRTRAEEANDDDDEGDREGIAAPLEKRAAADGPEVDETRRGVLVLCAILDK